MFDCSKLRNPLRAREFIRHGGQRVADKQSRLYMMARLTISSVRMAQLHSPVAAASTAHSPCALSSPALRSARAWLNWRSPARSRRPAKWPSTVRCHLAASPMDWLDAAQSELLSLGLARLRSQAQDEALRTQNAKRAEAVARSGAKAIRRQRPPRRMRRPR